MSSAKAPEWRAATADDVPAIDRIANSIHTMHERLDVLAEKISLFPHGCRVLVSDGAACGYALAFPWRVAEVPPLDSFLGAIPNDADCIFIYDVAILPAARCHGATGRFVAHASELADDRGLSWLALVSVYGTYPFWARRGFAVTPLPDTAAKLASYGDTARYMVSVIGTRDDTAG